MSKYNSKTHNLFYNLFLSIKEPVKLASIFMKPKTESKAKVLATDDKTLTQDISSVICSEKEPFMNASNQCVTDIDEANKVFSALFTGARSVKSAADTNTAELQTPAPWPVFNHVNQGDDYYEKNKCVQSNSRVKRINLCEALHDEGKFLCNARNNQRLILCSWTLHSYTFIHLRMNR